MSKKFLITSKTPVRKGINRVDDPNGAKFSLKVAGKDDLNSILAERAATVPASVVPVILNRTAGERFNDWNINLGETAESGKTDISVSWRGSSRRVRVHWNWGSETVLGVDSASFQIAVSDPENPVDLAEVGENGYVWQPDPLTNEEIETIKRYYLLLNDDGLKDEFREKVRAAGHTHSVSRREDLEARLY